jgi:hypothetical protein
MLAYKVKEDRHTPFFQTKGEVTASFIGATR